MILELIEEETPRNWPLVITGDWHSPPTIAQFKKDPSLYDTMPHGIYKITVDLEDFRDWGDSLRFQGYKGDPNKFISAKITATNLATSIANGFTQYNGTTYYLKGRFIKNGSEINFYLLEK